MMKLDRITIDPAQMNGQPCIRGMRLTVRRVVELAAIYPNREELRREFPELEEEDIRQALLYAATLLDDRIVELPEKTVYPPVRGVGDTKRQHGCRTQQTASEIGERIKKFDRG